MLVPQRPRSYTLHNDEAPGLYEPPPALPQFRERLLILEDGVSDPVFDGPLQPDGVHWHLGLSSAYYKARARKEEEEK